MVDEKKVITVFFLFYSFNVFSGDPSGISLYVKPLPSAMDYKYVVDGFLEIITALIMQTLLHVTQMITLHLWMWSI